MQAPGIQPRTQAPSAGAHTPGLATQAVNPKAQTLKNENPKRSTLNPEPGAGVRTRDTDQSVANRRHISNIQAHT